MEAAGVPRRGVLERWRSRFCLPNAWRRPTFGIMQNDGSVRSRLGTASVANWRRVCYSRRMRQQRLLIGPGTATRPLARIRSRWPCGRLPERRKLAQLGNEHVNHGCANIRLPPPPRRLADQTPPAPARPAPCRNGRPPHSATGARGCAPAPRTSGGAAARHGNSCSSGRWKQHGQCACIIGASVPTREESRP